MTKLLLVVRPSSVPDCSLFRLEGETYKHTYGGWASLYDITPDWHAIMGALPGVEGLYCVAGTSGHGFKLGPAVGEMMADLIVNGEKPEGDIDMFSVSRFDAGKEVTGKYEYSMVG